VIEGATDSLPTLDYPGGRNMSTKRHLLIAAIVALLISALTACGGEPSTSTPVPPTATRAETPTPSASQHLERGNDYADQGRFDEAIAEYERAIELAPDDAGLYRNMGSSLGNQERWQKAAAAYEKAIDLNPDFGEAYGDLVAAYISLGRVSDAVDAGERAIELSPDYAGAHSNLGVAYNEQGRTDEAIAQWKEAVELDPNSAKTRVHLGRAYGKQGRLDEAAAQLEEAVKIDPNHANAHFNLGMVYHLQEKSSQALLEFEETIKIDPSNAMAHYNLGIIHRDEDEAAEAIRAFETYLRLLPDAENRAMVEEEIHKLSAPGMVEYANAAGGYSLLLPEGWYTIENGTELGLAPSEEDYEADSLQSPLVTVITWPLDEAIQDFGLGESAKPEEFLRPLAEALGAETGEVGSAEISGYPAAFAATSGSSKDAPYRGDLVLILTEETLFFAEALAPPDQWVGFRPTFVDMINSVSFSAP
jgi:tetratricopeptide (TPR) repeat protein